MTASVRFAAPAVVPEQCFDPWCRGTDRSCGRTPQEHMEMHGAAALLAADMARPRFAAPATVPDDPTGDALGVLAGAFGPVDVLQMPFAAPAVVAYRVLVTGSREWDDVATIAGMLNDLHREHGDRLIIMHGACPRGADAIADEWCRTMGVPAERYPADWNAHGKSAGHRRNQVMVDTRPDRCLAFIRDASRGATGCAAAATAAGVETVRVDYRPPAVESAPSALLAAAAPEMAALDAANPVKQIAGLVTVVEPQPPATGGMVEALTAARDLMTTPAPYLDTLLSTPREEPVRVEQPTPAAVAKGMTIAAPADPRGMPKLAAAIRDELVNAVREYCASDPRSLQVDIGPSEIGHECDSYVIRRALGFPGVAQPDPWASFVGTAVHAKLADVFDACNRALGREHYLIERKVYVTDGIYGSCDLMRDGIVIDHKIVGVDSMRAIKKGWSEIPKYHKQVNEYGVGWVRAGYEVTHVAIAAWPRSGFLDGLHVLTDEFRPELAEQALERLAGLVQLAVETNLDESDEHWPEVPTAPGKACGFCSYYDPIMSHQGRVSAGLPPVPDKKACPMGREYQSDRSRGTGRGKGRLTP